ncbi:MAG: serine/threonine-protein kinase, partial [Phycisphaerales bacterium]
MNKSDADNVNDSCDDGTAPTASFDAPLKQPGSQIGQFRIERELGRGGAGIVYLAQDTKLDRKVAIKSLPPELMRNEKMRSGLKREAKLLASLDHPNIATIHDIVEQAESGGYLILEYIDGDTLAERISHRPLDLQEALSIALQIAEAVATAHESGVIHRDLKPGNIKITPEGKIKVLDFGLAKAIGAEVTDQQSTFTEPGRVIGTPAYMSPEQARGQVTDKRCDIWSFGCVLYEMLTGKVPFKGETTSDTLGHILQTEPDWQALPQATPANIRAMLRRCLEKDSRRRLHDIADAAIEIGETLSGTLEAFTLPGKVTPVFRLFRRDVILVALACLIAGVLIGGAISMTLVRPSPPEPPVVLRLPIEVPADKPLYRGTAPNYFLAISPDSTRLVCVGELDNRETELYMRSMDRPQVKPIPGTIGAHNPFFSPDGQWVGFFTEEGLKKVSLAGGEPLTLRENIQGSVAAFGSWSDDGTIIFSAPGGSRGLRRISDDGGQPETLIAPVPEEGGGYYRYPQVLPGGNAILYSHVSRASRPSRIEAFLPESGKRWTVLDNASYAKYVGSGHLIFVRGKALMAAPFDVRELKITGRRTILVDDNVGFDWGRRTPQITVSRNGTVAYISGSELDRGEFVWVDRQGVSTPLAGAPADVYSNPRLSPDGRLIAVEIWSQREFTNQVHIYDVERHTLIHLTTEGENRSPQWSPVGTRIAFWSNRTEGAGVFCKVVGASAPEELLASEPFPDVLLFPYSWSHNRNLLACTTVLDPDTQDDIWIVDPNGDHKPKPLLCTEYREYNPTFSPDGRWLAYVSEESGQREIYLWEDTDGGRRQMVSTDPGAGINPAWSRDGRELYYISGNNMMAVEVTSNPNFVIGEPEPLFELSDGIATGSYLGRNYDVSDDGRFLMIKKSDDAKDQLIVVQNW